MPLELEQALRGDRPPVMTRQAWQRMHDRSRELMVEALRRTVEAQQAREEDPPAHAFYIGDSPDPVYFRSVNTV